MVRNTNTTASRILFYANTDTHIWHVPNCCNTVLSPCKTQHQGFVLLCNFYTLQNHLIIINANNLDVYMQHNCIRLFNMKLQIEKSKVKGMLGWGFVWCSSTTLIAVRHRTSAWTVLSLYCHRDTKNNNITTDALDKHILINSTKNETRCLSSSNRWSLSGAVAAHCIRSFLLHVELIHVTLVLQRMEFRLPSNFM